MRALWCAVALACAAPGAAGAQAVAAARDAGLALLAAGQADSAVRLLAPLAASAPTDASAQLAYARALSARVGARRTRRILDVWAYRGALARAHAAAPRAPEVLEAWGWFHALAPWWTGASAAAAERARDTLLAVAPYRGELLAAGLARIRHDAPAAEAALRRALAAAPDSAPAYLQLAVLLEQQARYEEAMALIERYSALRPDDRQGLYLRGRIGGAGGVDLERAEAALMAALGMRRRPGEADSAQVFTALGRVLAKRGRLPEARDALRQALLDDPRDTDAKELRDSLAGPR
ncbi:MAG: tetratricopeptide repeat protein [Gemmatimonadales bacterium]|nr:tetratricopeptide repeat protein [Gemmatimonadales bacterium]